MTEWKLLHPIKLFAKKNLEIRFFTPNIWYPIQSGKYFIENQGNAPENHQIWEIPPPKKTKIVHINVFCEEQIRINRHFAIHFRKSVKFSCIYTHFIQNCLKYTPFHIKNNVKLNTFALISHPEWFSMILEPITKIEKINIFSWKSGVVQGYSLSR